MINIYGSQAYANVTVAGQDGVTGTTHLFIEPGSSRLYIIATAMSPTIWRLSGAVDRVARFVTWPRASANDGVGVTGLREEGIDFIPARLCFDASEGRSGRAVVEGRLKRPVTLMIAGHEITDVAVPSGERRFTPPDRNGSLTRLQDIDSPPGIDPWVYLQLADDAPAGVVEIDADEVISPGKAEDYEVLPRYAGLVQLMKEGRVEAVAGGGERRHHVAPVLHITQPIPRFPAGLGGNHLLKYRIGKDVPAPAGRVPVGNVTCEVTGGPARADSYGRPVCTGG